MIPRGNHRLKIGPIGKDVKRCFLALEKFFDDKLRARFAKRLRFHELVNRVTRCGGVLGDNDTLARSQSIGFDDDRIF